jgi:hypothetical protein
MQHRSRSPECGNVDCADCGVCDKAQLGPWPAGFVGPSGLLAVLASRAQNALGLGPQAYQADLRCYGADAILGPAEPETATSHEVAAILKICAPDQATATAIAKLANPLMLHMSLPAMSHLPSFAFMTSPAEIETGPIYEFVLNHVVAVDSESELFRTTYVEVTK